MSTVIQIVKAHLESNGYDGLVAVRPLYAAPVEQAPETAVQPEIDLVALETELVAECERAMRQRDEYLKTGARTGANGGAWDTVFGYIVRKHLSARAAPVEQAAQPSAGAVYLVATGETHEGRETYTRHEGAPPPLSDYEGPLYAATPSPTEEKGE
jgi:hypothetical protein